MPKMNVIKSIYIDSAPEKIYPILNDLNNCEQWSPWVIAEPRAQLNVASDGKFHEWDGDIIGTGNLKIQDEVENQSVTMALNFLKPWKSKAVTSFTLKKKPIVPQDQQWVILHLQEILFSKPISQYLE